jgi:hypothetical protein
MDCMPAISSIMVSPEAKQTTSTLMAVTASPVCTSQAVVSLTMPSLDSTKLAVPDVGRRVPDDIALIGFDNWEPMALGCEPPLTSIDMCLEDVGRTAAEHLISAINDSPTYGVHIVPSRLVLRESTDPQPPARQAKKGTRR